VVLDGYVRVSQVRGREGERFISPAVQREQIEGWIALRGARLGEVFEELDESGARADRPLLERALARVEAGESQGLVVAKLDRFGRSLVDGLAAIERIQRAGGTFVSVADGFDLTTETGRLIMRIMLAMGEWQLDRIRSSWDAARERAVERGVHCSPKAPTGYRRGPSGRLVIDGDDGPMISELFRRRAEGEATMSLCRRLEKRGVRTPYGNTAWSATSVRHILANRVYLGEARSGAFVKPGAHAPLTDSVTFQQAQAPREMTARKHAEPSLLGGLVRCAACSLAMRAYTVALPDGRRRRYYGCARRCAGGSCEAPASMAGSLLEPLVEQCFFEQLVRRRPRADRAGIRAAERVVERAEAALERYRDNDRAAIALGPERYADGLERRARNLERALLALGAARDRGDPDVLGSAEALERRWPEMSVRERRVAIAELIECVFVTRGHGRAASRVAICRRGDGPAELPARGCPGAVPQAFKPESCPRPPLAPTPAGARPPWSERRMRAELEAFLAGRPAWPPWDAFHAAGRGRLHDQVVLQGGTRLWAQRLDVEHPGEPPLKRQWTRERIRATLDLYLKDKAAWPTPEEFRADGFGQLRDAITRDGGIDTWLAEFGLPAPHHLRGPRVWWTDERLEAELRNFAAGREVFPTVREFRRAGRTGLLGALRRHGGGELWASRLGLPRRERYSGRIAAAR
jgi:DNA invertase Pin-like site-specific DNA recombinase